MCVPYGLYGVLLSTKINSTEFIAEKKQYYPFFSNSKIKLIKKKKKNSDGTCTELSTKKKLLHDIEVAILPI